MAEPMNVFKPSHVKVIAKAAGMHTSERREFSRKLMEYGDALGACGTGNKEAQERAANAKAELGLTLVFLDPERISAIRRHMRKLVAQAGAKEKPAAERIGYFVWNALGSAELELKQLGEHASESREE